MQGAFTRASGWLFMLTGMTFWLGWFLMPDAGTNEAAHILEAVSASRNNVWWSALVHILASLLTVIGVVGLQTERRSAKSKTMRVGAILVLIGALGVGMDAFFHLAAYYMTAPAIVPESVLEPMRLLQTQGIVFLIPLLLSFVVGGTVYSAGLYHIDATSAVAKRIFIIGLVWGVFGGLIAARIGTGRLIVAQGFIILVSLAYGWMGYEIVWRWRPEKQRPSQLES